MCPVISVGASTRFMLRTSSFTGVLAASLAASGPAVASDGEVPAAWHYDDAGASEAARSSTDWWRVFGDPQLDALIARMHRGNSTLPQVAARLASAEARARIGRADLMPQAGIEASATHANGPLINAAGGSGSLFTSRATITWEADVLGRLSGTRKAERLDVKSAEAALREARLLLEAETAQTFFACLRLQRAAQFADQRMALLEEAAGIMVARRQRGSISLVESNVAARRLAEAREEAGLAALTRDDALRRLALLTGDSSLPSLSDATLSTLPAIPAGLPAEVLARRPDIAAAISEKQAAGERLNSARRSWLPSLTLTASGGASPGLGQLFSSASRDFGLGMLFSLPLFDGGRHKALVKGSNAEADLAEARWRASVLNALREVNDSLGEVQQGRLGATLASDRLSLATADANAIAEGVSKGTRSRLAGIEAQLLLIEASDAAFAAHADALVSSVQLVKAIGGSW